MIKHILKIDSVIILCMKLKKLSRITTYVTF